MNERINELSSRARDYAREYVADCKQYGYYMEHNEYDLQFEAKFAELIVKECAQVLETNGDNQRTIRMTESTGHDKTTDWMEGYEEAVKQYGGFLLKKNAKQIKKHFGVEE
jgi:hypothetical protein